MTAYCHIIITIVILSQKYCTLKANMSLSSKAYLAYTNLESYYSYSLGTPNAYLRPRRGRKGDNWSISFSPVVCYHPYCSHCYSEVVKSEEPYIIISGLSLHDREVTKANKKFQKKRKHIATIREMQNYVEALKVLNAT